MGAPHPVADIPETAMRVGLEDKYTRECGWIFLTGNQALVRLAIQQRVRDAAAGLNTAAYVSGYRGSPLGRFDMEMWHAKAILQSHDIEFRAAINEDLAATAIWGSQYVGSMYGLAGKPPAGADPVCEHFTHTFGAPRVDGVFGIWYGKGPGVDRCGDVFRHANSAGTSRFGGVVALAGDDHGARSSTVVNFSDGVFIATGMPVLYPSNTQELLDFGLHGIAMSRYSGCWVGMKVVTDVVEGGGTIFVAPHSPAIVVPQDRPDAPARSIRALDALLPQEARLYNHKLHAALRYARLNGLNKVTHGARPEPLAPDGKEGRPRAASPAREAHASAAAGDVSPAGRLPGWRIGIISAGKAYQDLLQALADLDLTESALAAMGVGIAKIGMIWPLDPDFVVEFASGLQTLLVIEEKRALLEEQVRSALYTLPDGLRPVIVGKFKGAHPYAAERGPEVIAGVGETSAAMVSKILIELLGLQPAACGLVAPAAHGTPPGAPQGKPPVRMASFCSGCPHNRSTKLPAGSRALAGIGCHTIALIQDPLHTTTVSQMGGEGVMWLGQFAFTHEKHVFANMGDGTYFHSGFLAIRQAIAAHAPMTYKILVNGFVAMTGGQPIDGEISVARIASELLTEGAREVVVVSDEPAKYANASQHPLPPQVRVYHRSALQEVMLRLREVMDVTILIYEQPCATERRRLRKRGLWSDPQVRVFINQAVCEGCGDCGQVSGCMAIEPVETALGRKRRINQDACNKDYTCVEGFCPGFVTVHGARLRGREGSASRGVIDGLGAQDLPVPHLEAVRTTRASSILIAGIGGTGVVTLGQILGMAAHMDGLRCTVLDVTGLAQKYGAVLSHVRIATDVAQLGANRISAGEADTVIGCDLIVTASAECLSTLRAGRTRVAVCTDLVPTSDFSRNPEWDANAAGMLARIQDQLGSGDETCFAATPMLEWATALLGQGIAANMMLLGLAWQKGWIPIGYEAMEQAIALNGVQVTQSMAAFAWGRRIAAYPQAVRTFAGSALPLRGAAHANTSPGAPWHDQTLEQLIVHRTQLLREYQPSGQLARIYAQKLQAVLAAAAVQGRDKCDDSLSARLVCTIATQYYRLLAVKDEWEVARLYAAAEFAQQLQESFAGELGRDFHIRFHLGVWPFARSARPAHAAGRVTKTALSGTWLLPLFGLMSRLRILRGTWLDPFRNSEERREARALLVRYEEDIARMVTQLNPGLVSASTLQQLIDKASWPQTVRGYGHVRRASAKLALSKNEEHV